MLPLHKPAEVFSPRHLPTWLMLSFSSGCTNALALLACERYVTHVTGTVTRLGMEKGHPVTLLDFGLVLVSFIAGAMLSSWLINGRAHRNLRPMHAAPLFIVSAATIAVAALGHAGLLGPFGGAPDEAGDFVLLSVLSFAAGLQNAAVATSTGLLIRTTHLTGPATDLGIHLVEMLYVRGAEHRAARNHALLRAGKILFFAIGAAAGAMLSVRVEFLGFAVPGGLVLLATLLSFTSFSPEEPAERTDVNAPKAGIRSSRAPRAPGAPASAS